MASPWDSPARGISGTSRKNEMAGTSPATPKIKTTKGVGSNRSGDPLLQLLLRRGTDLTRGQLAILEQHQRRDRHDAVFGGGAVVLVDIQFDDLDLAVERIRNLFKGRRDHATGAAPFRPEVDDD